MLANIALAIPLSTAWPERGFSTMARVKSKTRNRLLDITLSALLNISLNGPQELSSEAAGAIADKWLCKKKRRTVTERKLDKLNVTDLDDLAEDDMMLDSFQIDLERFYL